MRLVWFVQSPSLCVEHKYHSRLAWVVDEIDSSRWIGSNSLHLSVSMTVSRNPQIGGMQVDLDLSIVLAGLSATNLQ